MYPTPSQLLALGARAGDVARVCGPLSDACVHYGITTPERVAAFLAQVFHESGRLRYLKELWGPTPAQSRYEGRADLGNIRPGDGSRFRGRGLIQVTGRTNYQRMRDFLRRDVPNVPDFEASPELLELPQWAAYSAAAFWAAHNLNALADAGDFDGITKRINGGTNGQAERRALWAQAKKVIA